MDSIGSRILEIISLPPMMRCPELGLLIDRASLKELQDIYPILINSIFGINTGSWGLRLMTRDTHPHDFDVLYNYFIPIGGPMFRLCYRLLNDSLKYEFPISYLPPKMQQMVETHRSAFYADIVNIDPFRRQIVSLSLNAFDYFMFHFAVHGTIPLQHMHSTATTFGNDRAKTLYLILTAEYLCTFLPCHPDSVVLPQIIGGSIKISSPTTLPVMQPAKSPKYLNLSAIHHHTPATVAGTSFQRSVTSSANMESPRTYCWRSESVLYIFIDCWLRLDVDDARELPSNEFIRCVRILVKQLHSFGNSAEIDSSAMALLRQTAQPLMNDRMYGFLKSLIARWPLDSSFSDVLELWLSYIQPWRYTFNRSLPHAGEITITPRYLSFIAENLIVYTQIFVQLIPRFERMDLTTLRNVLMLFRLCKVYSQTKLMDILSQCELEKSNNNMPGNSSNFNISHSPINLSGSSNRSTGNTSGHNRSGGEWKSLNSSGPTIGSGVRPNTPGSRSAGDATDDSYVFIFEERFRLAFEEFLKKIYVSILVAKENLKQVQQERQNRYRGVLKYIYKVIGYFDYDPVYEAMYSDRQKIPEILDVVLQSFARMFQIPITQDLFDGESLHAVAASMTEEPTTTSWNVSTDSHLSSQSFTLTPQQMKSRRHDLQYTGDPALLPIGSTEFTFLVRFLHQLSCKLNIMFDQEMYNMWYRKDIWGRLSRQVLCSPMVTQTFDKSQGTCVLKRDTLGPRICLRLLASYKSSFVILISFCLGHLLFGAPSYGLLFLFMMTFLYLFIRSLFCDVDIQAFRRENEAIN